MKITQFLIAVLILFTLSVTSTVFGAELKLAVGVVSVENIFSKIEEPFEKETGIKLVYDHKGLGANEVFEKVDKSQVDGGAVGGSFDVLMGLMKEKHYPVADPTIYKTKVIGGDRVIVVLNKSVKVKSLSANQLVDVFTGTAKSWKDVGGNDLPIKIGRTDKLVGTERFFRISALQGKEFTKDVKTLDDGSKLQEWLMATPGAIVIGPAGFENPKVNKPEQPDIKRPITFFTKGIPSENVQKLLRFIVENGDKYHIIR